MERSRLTAFLDQGRGIYIEGTDFGPYNYNYELYGYFGCTWLGDGDPMIPGNVSHLNGAAGTIFENYSFDYLYQDFPDNFVDFINQNNGLIFFESQDARGRAVYYGGSNDSYRAIHSTVLFGGVQNGTCTKTELMETYMDYLTETMVIRDTNVVIIDDVLINSITLAPNPSCGHVVLSFSLSTEQHVAVTLYNTVGQQVRQLINEDLSKGIHNVIWDATDDNNHRLSNGTYLVRVRTDRETFTKPVVLIR